MQNNQRFLGHGHSVLLNAHQCKQLDCLWARQDTTIEQKPSIHLFRLLSCVCVLLPAPEFHATGQSLFSATLLIACALLGAPPFSTAHISTPAVHFEEHTILVICKEVPLY